MEIYVVGAVIIVLLLILLFKNPRANVDTSKLEERIIRMEAQLDKIAPQIETEFRENRKEITGNFRNINDSMNKTVQTLNDDVAKTVQNLNDNMNKSVRALNEDVNKSVKDLQDSNEVRLSKMQETVDEKLQASVEKRFDESFKQISNQLTQVYQGLGEMKNLATGVGDLRKVMEGVKTRGIYGEVQLGSIIEDMMPASQYEENIATKQNSSDRVEFAIKMPGKNEETVFLPIDSKFPVENYSRLIAAYDEGDKVEIEKWRKALKKDVEEQAKKISTKYLNPPHTTDFGMMFVPTESLYAEILRIPGLSDALRQKYNIVLSSPSTLPVTLSGLTMGFRSVAIEKRSSEVWATLGAVKTQFGKFSDLLAATKKKLEESANKIGSAETTSRQIERKLKDVETLPESESVKLIGEIGVE